MDYKQKRLHSLSEIKDNIDRLTNHLIETRITENSKNNEVLEVVIVRFDWEKIIRIESRNLNDIIEVKYLDVRESLIYQNKWYKTSKILHYITKILEKKEKKYDF